MLAYVFSHWPRPDVRREAYEEGLIAFHEHLAAYKPLGFQRSAVFRSPALPWLGAPGEIYQDWYLIIDSNALDALNTAVATTRLQPSHDAIAAYPAGGAAGLYRLRLGAPDLVAAISAQWLSKPAGVSYEALYQMLTPAVSRSRAGLWGRQMGLGPGPEFCLLAQAPPALPDPIEATTIMLDCVWSA